jgi:hypothetical protein
VLDSIPLEEIGRVATKSKTGSKKTLIDRIEKHLGVDLDGDGLIGGERRDRGRALSLHTTSPTIRNNHAFLRDSHHHLISGHPNFERLSSTDLAGVDQDEEFLDAEANDEDDSNVFAIYPLLGGLNAGKPTVFKVYPREELIAKSPGIKEAADECDKWVAAISAAFSAHLEQKRAHLDGGTALGAYQRRARSIYRTTHVQVFVGCVILASYVSALVGSQIGPAPGSDAERYLTMLEWFFTLVFLLELLLNAFGHWFKAFLTGWNIFDTVVVVCSVASLSIPSLPPFNALRLVRIFKMVRIFRRVTSLRILIDALSSSIFPVLNGTAFEISICV